MADPPPRASSREKGSKLFDMTLSKLLTHHLFPLGPLGQVSTDDGGHGWPGDISTTSKSLQPGHVRREPGEVGRKVAWMATGRPRITTTEHP